MVVNAKYSENEFRVFTCDTRTGRVLAELPVTDQSWGMRLNDSGPLSADVNCYTAEAEALDIRNVTAKNRCCLGVAYGDFILECGPIDDRDFDAKTGKLSLTANGLWSIFDRRKMLMGHVLPQSYENVMSSIWVMGPTSLRTIAREIVRVSIEENPYLSPDGLSAGHLPIVLPDSIAGGETRTYYGYEQLFMGDVLRKLSQLSGGPDIRFLPRFKPGEPTYVEWVMETGTPEKPLLKGTGDPWIWDGSRPDSGVKSLSTKEAGVAMASRSWVAGQGQEAATPLRKATDLTIIEDGGPWLEADVPAKQEESVDILQSIADREVVERRTPTVTISVSVRADYWPFLGEYVPGDMAQIVVPEGHPTLDPGPLDTRIMALDGGGDGIVKLTVAPVKGTLAGSKMGQSMTYSVDVPALYPGIYVYPGYMLFPSE